MRARRLRLNPRPFGLAALACCGIWSTTTATAAADPHDGTRVRPEITSAASPPLGAGPPTLVPRRWSRPYVTATFVYNGLYGSGAALEAAPHPMWAIGLELVSSRLGLFLTGRLHFVPELRRGGRHQFQLGLGGDVGVTPSVAAGGLAAWMAPTVDLRYLVRPHPSFGFTLGTRCGVGFSWEARDLSPRARQPSTPLDHLALVLVTYAGLSFGHHTRR